MKLAPTCARTGKRGYASERDARAARRRHYRLGSRLRPYRCAFCARWHLTSQPKEWE